MRGLACQAWSRVPAMLPLRRQGDAPRVRALRGFERSSWSFVVDIGSDVGPRQQSTKGVFATKREAVAAMKSCSSRRFPARTSLRRSSRWSSNLEQWLPNPGARLRPGAYDACALHVRAYIAPRIGDVPLQALTPTKVKALCADLRKAGRRRGGGALPAKTVHNVHRTLSRALGDAVADRLLLANPAERAHRPPESPEMPTWSAEQLRAFLDYVADDHHAALWRVAATTGLRRGDLAGLRWRDVDLDAGRVTVSSSAPRAPVRSQPDRRRRGGAAGWSPSTPARWRRSASTARPSWRSGS